VNKYREKYLKSVALLSECPSYILFSRKTFNFAFFKTLAKVQIICHSNAKLPQSQHRKLVSAENTIRLIRNFK